MISHKAENFLKKNGDAAQGPGQRARSAPPCFILAQIPRKWLFTDMDKTTKIMKRSC